MQFLAYSDYKASGVEWLGDVPSHWNIVRFGKLFSENKRKNTGLIETNVLSLSYGNIKEKNIDDNKGLLPESFETYQIIQPNDIVFRFTDLQNDKRSLRNAISKFHGIITSAYISVNTEQNSNFYNYLFRAYDLQKVFYSMGDGMRQSLKMDELNRMPVVLPPINEQNQIAQFLDKETAKMDELIAKQEQLIVLLEEQRKSVISHAVTKGLDPNAPMKDSGVEWLGEVPSHWQDYSYQHLFKKKEIINQTQEQLLSVYLDRGVIPYAEGGGLVHKPADSLEKYQLVDIDDFVMNNQQAWRGSVGISAYRGIVSPAYLIFSINKDLASSKFLKYLLKDKSIVEQFMLASMSVGTIQRQIKWHLLKNLHINLPPINEQNQIAQFLDKETAKIDGLIQKQQELITQLKEYRTSVISHAVTGKIDIRGLL